MNHDNDHGWTAIPAGERFTVTDGGNYRVRGKLTAAGAVITHYGRAPDRATCGCAQAECLRAATEEDLLCDDCREQCRQFRPVEFSVPAEGGTRGRGR